MEVDLRADPKSVVLADFPHRQQAYVAKHAFDLLVRLIRDGQRGPAHRRGDGHPEFLHRQLYGAYGRVAVRAECHKGEYPPVQLRRFGEVAALRGLHRLNEQLGGYVGESAYGTVGPGEEGGQDQVLPPCQHREAGPYGLELTQHAYGVWKYSAWCFNNTKNRYPEVRFRVLLTQASTQHIELVRA